MYCTRCGAAQSDTARFCSRCGTQLDDANRNWQAPPERSRPAAPAPQPPTASAPPASTSYWAGRAVPPIEHPPPAAPAYTPPPQPSTYGYIPPPQPTAPLYTPSQPSAPTAPGASGAPGAPDRVAPALRHHRAIAAAAVIVLGGLAVAGWRVHWPPALFGSASAPALTWSATQAPLPADATRTADQDAALNDVACPVADSCVAVGTYDSGSNADTGRGLIETLSGGVWSPAAAPVSVPGAGQIAFVNLGGVACPSMATCVAVGTYFNRQDVQGPLTETRAGSTWASARPPLPGDAGQGKPAFLSQVACPAPGSCVATGWYSDKNGDTEAVIETLSGGAWTAARAPVPADAAARPATGTYLPTDLVAVRCPAAGSCVATGDYIDSQGHTEGLIDTLTDGTWTAARAPLPADAAANPAAYLWALNCQAPGSCLAAGHYNDRGGQSRDLVATLSGGTWTPAATPLPADASASQKWSLNQITGLTSLACQQAGACAAEGSYFARNGTVVGVIASLSGGTWTAARAPLPDGAAGAKQYAFFDSAACPAPGTCFVVGGYRDQAGGTVPMIETGTPKSG